MHWQGDPLAHRRAERERLIGLARQYVRLAAERLPVEAAVVAGSVARGDFNRWSDVDVVVVSEALPPNPRERLALLDQDRPGLVEVHGYTPHELRRALERRDPLAHGAVDGGVPLLGSLDAYGATR